MPRMAAEEPAHLEGTERVLKAITELYDSGLSNTSGSIGLRGIADDELIRPYARILRPRKKVSVMIVGNHSAGKSSFINWYLGEEIQKTGVAIETRGFTILTRGRRRETLTGDATMKFFGFLEGFDEFEGIRNNLFTEISTSNNRHFRCVDFIDTPGLVDGQMQYPFNVQDTLLWMADHVDLILVFFDPIGQAACRRTMEVVERLNKGPHVEKIQYFMSKADEVKKEHDRQRVLIQITQNLAPRIKNSHAFDLPTFYLPDDGRSDSGIPNAIQDVCQTIDKAISTTVQKNLNNLAEDCKHLFHAAERALADDLVKQAANRAGRIQGLCLSLISLVCFGVVSKLVTEELAATPQGKKFFHALPDNTRNLILDLSPNITQPRPGTYIFDGAVHKGVFVVACALLLAATVLRYMALVLWRVKPVLKRSEVRRIMGYKQVIDAIGKEQPALYKEYFGSITASE